MNRFFHLQKEIENMRITLSKQVIESDILIVGNGGAGLRAAVEAAQCGMNVVLVFKIGPRCPWRGSILQFCN